MPDFNYWTTHMGSVPHLTPGNLPERLVNLLDIPAWTQHPRRSFRENMYSQYTPTLPAVVIDEAKEKVSINTHNDLSSALEKFYSLYLEDDIASFALRPDHAAGFFAMLDVLKSQPPANGKPSWAKGQVTGPISFGLTVTDQDLRASLYNEILVDVIIKNIAMVARWQIRQLKNVREQVLIFLDEPYLASFGSAYVNLSPEQVRDYLDEIYDAIHAEGAIGGVHCCANTDWGLLLSTKVDMLNLDAYDYLENLALYPVELREFLDRGGSVCWGLIPNNKQIMNETPGNLAARLQNGIQSICEKAAFRGIRIRPDEFATRSLLAPACGLATTTPDVADRAFDFLAETSAILKRG